MSIVEMICEHYKDERGVGRKNKPCCMMILREMDVNTINECSDLYEDLLLSV